MKKSVFVFWLAVFGFSAVVGFAQSFPAGFQGTWKRPQYASTLSFTGNTVKASNRDVVWTLRSVAGNKYAIVSSSKGATLSLTIRLVSGKLEISGDSGKGEANWNGSYASVKAAISATPTVTFNAQGGSAVAAQTVNDGIPAKKRMDATHIAVASVHRLQYVVSWNFKHINKERTRKMVYYINRQEGYEAITLCEPWEVIYDGTET
jgi:hypothetical protein